MIFKNGKFRSVLPEGVKFYKDSEILKLHPTIQKIDLGDNITADRTDNGKIVILQQAKRGCTAAVAAMLIHDAGKSVNLNSLRNTNLGNTGSIKRWISEAGLIPKVTKLSLQDTTSDELLNRLQKLIESRGPAIVSTGNDIGSHVIVVDEINTKAGSVRLRDPYHGWAITVTKEAFLRGFDGGRIIQIA